MRFGYLVFLLMGSFAASAQDILQKIDGSKLEVKVLEISDTQVRYKLKANPDGPVYVIAKEDVILISYESGYVEIIPKEVEKKKAIREVVPVSLPDEIDYSKDFKRNYLYFIVTDVVASSFTVGYEHTAHSGYSSFKIPFSIGMRSNAFSAANETKSTMAYYSKYKDFSTGLDFCIYPTGQGKTKFYFGPSLEYGTFSREMTYYNPQSMKQENLLSKGDFYSFVIQNGILIQSSPDFNISLHFGGGITSIGIRKVTEPVLNYDLYYDEGLRMAVRAGVSLGYKF